MKRFLPVMLIFVLGFGCGKNASEKTVQAGKGVISGTISVRKPEKALIYVAIANSFDELSLGRVAKLSTMKTSGPFRFDDVDAGTYRLGAFVDLDGNTQPDISMEPYWVLESKISISGNEKIENISVERFFNERDPSYKTTAVKEEYARLLGDAERSTDGAYERLKEQGTGLLTEVIPTLRAMVFEAQMKWAVTGNAADWEHVRALLEPVPGTASAAVKGNNELDSSRGFFLRAYLSDLDASVQRYAVWVPPEYDGSRRFPLVIALHGAGGDHWAGMKMVTGATDLLVGAEKTAEHFFPTAGPRDFIIACPNGYGYMGPGYREKGEYDVLKVLKEMFAHYNIDPDRVYLTGASKGGRGTWEIGLKYPDLFEAIAPVCGGTELARQLAGNAGNLHIYVFHGTDDLIVPVDQSRQMVHLLERSGVRVEYFELAGLGHDAAWMIYKEGAIFDFFKS